MKRIDENSQTVTVVGLRMPPRGWPGLIPPQ
jgi:hypothetical protein